MHFRLLLLFAFLSCANLRAQEFYSGVTFDYNSGIGERYTYGLGLHFEARAWRCKNLYFNWHYALGSNTHGELYGHGGMSLLLYKDSDWWRTSSLGEFMGVLIGPLFIPNGVTYYFPDQVNRKKQRDVRLGVYCNPISLEFWNMEPHKVTSWSVETGAKLLWQMQGGKVLYLSGGVNFTNNLRRQRVTGYGNEQLVQLQLGILGWSDL